MKERFKGVNVRKPARTNKANDGRPVPTIYPTFLHLYISRRPLEAIHERPLKGCPGTTGTLVLEPVCIRGGA